MEFQRFASGTQAKIPVLAKSRRLAYALYSLIEDFSIVKIFVPT